MIKETYQKTYEGGNITVPKNGVIAFYVLKDSTLVKVRVAHDELSDGVCVWRLRKETSTLATITIDNGTRIGASDDISVACNRFDILLLDLTNLDVEVNTPVALELEFEEAIILDYNDLDNLPDTFPPSPHNHDDRYYTETETDNKDTAVANAAAADATTKANAAQAAAATDATTKANAAQAFAIQRGNHTGSQAESTITGLVSDLAARELTANKGIAGGYASLDGGGLVPAAQLPSYVDDVLEYANFAALPGTGVSGKIYITIDTTPNKQWRWTGSAYQDIVQSPGTTDALVEGSVNKYWTNARTIASVLTGFAASTVTAIVNTDTILQALQKVQAWLSSLGTMSTQNANAVAITGGSVEVATVQVDTNLILVPFVGATLSSMNHNYTPGTDRPYLLLSNAGFGDMQISGLVAPAGNGTRKVIRNNDASDEILIKHQNTSSIAANRFLCANNGDIRVRPGQEVTLIYSTAVSRWLVAGGFDSYQYDLFYALYNEVYGHVATDLVAIPYTIALTDMESPFLEGIVKPYWDAPCDLWLRPQNLVGHPFMLAAATAGADNVELQIYINGDPIFDDKLRISGGGSLNSNNEGAETFFSVVSINTQQRMTYELFGTDGDTWTGLQLSFIGRRT